MKLNCIHVATCLPQFWRGSNYPTIPMPVHNGMTLDELKTGLLSIIERDSIWYDGDEEFLEAAKESIKNIKVFDEEEPVFELPDTNHEVYAYFILTEDKF